MKNVLGKNLKFLRESKGVTQSQLSDLVGKGHNTVGYWEKGHTEPSLSDLTLIVEYFDININDILFTDLANAHLIQESQDKKNTDKSTPNRTPNRTPNIVSEPLVPYIPKVVTVDKTGNENVVFVPVKARAGYLAGYGDPEYIQNLPTYSLPGIKNGTYRMFEVAGYSMHPTFTESDILICQSVENQSTIKNDKAYVVVTKDQGIVVKRLLSAAHTPHKLILSSDNHQESNNYPPIIIEASEIIEIWAVQALFTRHIANPSTAQKDLSDIKARLTLLEDSFTKFAK